MGKWLLETLGTAAATAALIGAAAWLARQWIKARLLASIQLETDKQLHEFKARLEAAEATVRVVRDTGITATLQLSEVVIRERVEAAKQIWHGIIEWRQAAALVTLTVGLTPDFKPIDIQSPFPRAIAARVIESVQPFNLTNRMNDLQKWRPFITETAWTLWTGYHGFYASRMIAAERLARGESFADVARDLQAIELSIVRLSVPGEVAERHNPADMRVIQDYLSWIQEALIVELRRFLTGEDSGPAAAKQAARLNATVDEVIQDAAIANRQTTVN